MAAGRKWFLLQLFDMIVAAIVILILGWKITLTKKYVLLLDIIFCFCTYYWRRSAFNL